MGGLNAGCHLSTLRRCVGSGLRCPQHRVFCPGWSRQSLGRLSPDSGSDRSPLLLNNVSDPMAAIETKKYAAHREGQILRHFVRCYDRAVREPLTGDPAQQAAANDKARGDVSQGPEYIAVRRQPFRWMQYQRSNTRRKDEVKREDKAAGQTGGGYCGEACVPRRIVRGIVPSAGCLGRFLQDALARSLLRSRPEQACDEDRLFQHPSGSYRTISHASTCLGTS